MIKVAVSVSIICPASCGGCGCHSRPPCGHCTDGHDTEQDRIIEIVNYSVSKGSPGHMYPTYDCGGCPPEPPELNDIEAIWQDTKEPLTDDDMETHGERIGEIIWEYLNDD